MQFLSLDRILVFGTMRLLMLLRRSVLPQEQKLALLVFRPFRKARNDVSYYLFNNCLSGTGLSFRVTDPFIRFHVFHFIRCSAIGLAYSIIQSLVRRSIILHLIILICYSTSTSKSTYITALQIP